MVFIPWDEFLNVKLQNQRTNLLPKAFDACYSEPTKNVTTNYTHQKCVQQRNKIHMVTWWYPQIRNVFCSLSNCWSYNSEWHVGLSKCLLNEWIEETEEKSGKWSLICVWLTSADHNTTAICHVCTHRTVSCGINLIASLAHGADISGCFTTLLHPENKILASHPYLLRMYRPNLSLFNFPSSPMQVRASSGKGWPKLNHKMSKK